MNGVIVSLIKENMITQNSIYVMPVILTVTIKQDIVALGAAWVLVVMGVVK